MKRPSATFSKGKHGVLNSFRYAIKQFLYNITHLKVNQIRPMNVNQFN